MQFVYFQINALFPEHGAEQLNAFTSTHTVSSVMEKFVDDGRDSFWSVRVAVVDKTIKQADSTLKSTKQASVDYKEVLSPEHFSIYAKLRTLRNTLAEQQNIPAYAIFTNEQLAEMAKLKQVDKKTISEIDGIGEKRLALYVDQFLTVLLEHHG